VECCAPELERTPQEVAAAAPPARPPARSRIRRLGRLRSRPDSPGPPPPVAVVGGAHKSVEIPSEYPEWLELAGTACRSRIKGAGPALALVSRAAPPGSCPGGRLSGQGRRGATPCAPTIGAATHPCPGLHSLYPSSRRGDPCSRPLMPPALECIASRRCSEAAGFALSKAGPPGCRSSPRPQRETLPRSAVAEDLRLQIPSRCTNGS